MFSNFDFDVIARSWPYLFKDGHRLGYDFSADAFVKICRIAKVCRYVRQHYSLAAVSLGDLLVLFFAALHWAMGLGL